MDSLRINWIFQKKQHLTLLMAIWGQKRRWIQKLVISKSSFAVVISFWWNSINLLRGNGFVKDSLIHYKHICCDTFTSYHLVRQSTRNVHQLRLRASIRKHPRSITWTIIEMNFTQSIKGGGKGDKWRRMVHTQQR